MKLRYRFCSLACLLLLSSCRFNSEAEYVNYLVDKYVLINVVDYEESLMHTHSFINTSGLVKYNHYFILNDTLMSFNYGPLIKDISFDCVITPKDREKIELDGIKYEFVSVNSDTSIVMPEYNGNDFSFIKVTVFPNYWLRVYSKFQINYEEKDLIFEFKSSGRNTK